MTGARAPLLLALWAVAGGPPAAAPSQVTPPPSTEQTLPRRLEAAWQARDVPAYLALWDLPDEEARARETAFAATRFAADEVTLQVQGPRPRAGTAEMEISAQVFIVNEPRSKVEEFLFRLAPREGGWALVGREELSSIDGLYHLSLSPRPFRADGITLALEDFELQMQRGSLFATPPEVGPTALVFVGQGRVRFRPRPPAEQAQLRLLTGRDELDDGVRSFFMRLHPADFHRVLSPARLDPDPRGARRLSEARKVFREHVERSFVLDTALPRSPWWMLPPPGDVAVTFRTRRHGTLTFTVAGSEMEGISLADRERRRQIALYPQAGRDTRYNEDQARAVNVLEHDLRVRFEPSRYGIEAEDTLRLRIDMATPTLRLRLHESLRVHSVRSAEAGEHLFFRIRDQDGLLVSLGALSGYVGEVTLTVRYGGVHRPVAVERELQAVRLDPREPSEPEIVIEEVLVYSNRTAWYPQALPDDYARARIRADVPEGYTALTGGERRAPRREGGRTLIEYVQDRPGKYITVAVGRFHEMARAQEGPVTLEAFSVGRTRREAGEALAQAADMLRFFEREFGPYPYASLRLGLIEGYTPGGHSPPGMVILAQRPPLMRSSLRPDPAGFWDIPGFFLAHELAHQWWGHGMAGQNYRERWISEAFAQYAAALWARERQGEERFQDVLGRMARWALRHTDQGPIHLGHRLGHLKQDPQIFRAVVYDKGAYVLHMLRRLVGEEAFRAALRSIQERFRFRKAGTEDVREALEAASGRDLSQYFEAWVYGTELPRLQVQAVRQRASSAYRTVVEVRADAVPAPVPLQVRLEHGGEVLERTVLVEPAGGRFTFETEGPVKKVEVNADRGLLAWIKGP